MGWFPVGPDFVFAPRNIDFRRLSRRNEMGRQGLPTSIAVDQSDPNTIYVAESPGSGGNSAFRSRDGGGSWTSISDALHQTDPASSNVNCVAINPALPSRIYMAAWSGSFYVSSDRGDTWSVGTAIPDGPSKLLIDSRTAANPATTVLLAASSSGVYRSPDGGATWTNVLPGNVTSLVGLTPSVGTAHFYAGIYGSGLFHATDPTAAANWTNLNGAGIGLPAYAADNFHGIQVDFCRRNPDRVYAWLAKESTTVGLYTTGAPLTAWTQIAAVSPPDPGQGFYSFAFAVAPSSPGDGVHDVLFIGSTGLFRSADGGITWVADGTGFHADQHCFAFFPENPPAGVVPAVYVGCDGGLASSSKAADPAFAFGAAATDFDEGLSYSNSGVWQNLNHGKQSSAVYQYSSHPSVSSASYIGCQDTGIAAGCGALGWRGIADADGGAIAAAPGPSGIAAWGSIGAFCDWPGFRVWVWNDRGEYAPAAVQATLGAGGSLLASSSNFVVGLDGNCLAGVASRRATTLAAPVGASGPQVATPASMADIAVGTVLAVGGDPCSDAAREDVTVSAVSATTFTANFAKTHPAGSRVRIEEDQRFVARIPSDGVAAQISQEFASNISIIAADPGDANILYGADGAQQLWTTTSGSTASSATVWTEIAGGKPAGIQLSAVTVGPAGQSYVLLTDSATTGGSETGTITSPLFEVSSGNWIHQQCSNLPAGGGFGKLVADPSQADTLYAGQGARVFRLKLVAGVWDWQDVSDGLPGQWIYDLWIGNIAHSGPAKVLLRAAIPTRGVWERDVTAGATEPTVALYVRDNVLDQGWLARCPEGVPSPYDPANPGATVYHYQCADIKVDARQHPAASVVAFYQTDPEGGSPLSHVLFDQLKDNSQALPQGDAANVHVQVHNRSSVTADNVRVWALYCNASAGVPSLQKSPSSGDAFPFWDQFTVTGQIVPNLPADSPWKAIGPPQTVSGIDAANPRVVTWNWTVPALGSSDPGHYCVVAFIHSAGSLINETSFDVDEMTPRNKQVGQKNVHIGPPLPPSPGSGGGGTGIGAGGRMREYIEFHNPGAAARRTSLVIDMRGLPPSIQTSFKLTKLQTLRPLSQSLSGIARIDEPTGRDRIAGLLELIGRIVQRLGCLLENIGRWLVGRSGKPCPKRGSEADALQPQTYVAEPSARIEVRDVEIPELGFVAAELLLENRGALDEGSEYSFQEIGRAHV